jgi:hypothetical protein
MRKGKNFLAHPLKKGTKEIMSTFVPLLLCALVPFTRYLPVCRAQDTCRCPVQC